MAVQFEGSAGYVYGIWIMCMHKVIVKRICVEPWPESILQSTWDSADFTKKAIAGLRETRRASNIGKEVTL